MNWAAMTPQELISYASLNLTTDLERALFAALEFRSEDDSDMEGYANEATAAQAEAEADKEAAELKMDEIREILDSEDSQAEQLADIAKVLL